MWLRAADDEARTTALRVLLEMPQRALPKPTRGGGGGRVRERAMRGRIMRWEEEVRAGCLQPAVHPPEMRPSRMREETDESRRKKAEWVAVRKGIAKGAQVLERLPPITIDTEGVIGQLARQLPSRDERGSLPLRPPRAGHANVWLDWELRPQEHRGTLDRLLATHASAGPSGLELNHLRAVTRGKGEPRALAALMSLLSVRRQSLCLDRLASPHPRLWQRQLVVKRPCLHPSACKPPLCLLGGEKEPPQRMRGRKRDTPHSCWQQRQCPQTRTWQEWCTRLK